MFEHLVRDGTILFLIGVTTLTKVAPAIRQKQYSEEMLKYSIWIGWILTVLGFAFMVTGSVIDSW
jgi:hypothetical protein